jgi:hypothetical protein
VPSEVTLASAVGGLGKVREHRSEPRVDVARLAYVIELGDGKVEAIARVLDESTQGIGLLLPRALAVGVRVEIRVRGALGLEFLHRGTVMHGEAAEAGFFRVGVRFDEAPESVKSEEEPWPT